MTALSVNLLNDRRLNMLNQAFERCLKVSELFESWKNRDSYISDLQRSFDETLGFAKNFPSDLAIRLYEDILKTRIFYDESIKHIKKGGDGTIAGPVFTGYWQEAVGVAVAHAMGPEDFLYPSHRDLSAYIARGESLDRIWLNHLGKLTGPTKGYDANLHFMDYEHRNFGFQVSTMGVSAVIGPGPVIPANKEKELRLGRSLQPDERIAAVAIFGDGASSNGVVHEGMNLAKAWNIPVLFVLLDNRIAISVSAQQQHGGIDLTNRAIAYEMPGITLDGNDVILSYLGARWMLTFSRRAMHPSFMRLITFRRHGHNEIEDSEYAKDVYGKEEFERLCSKENDPLYRIRTELVELGILNEESVRKTVSRIRKDVLDSYSRSVKEPDPPTDRTAFRDPFVDPQCKVTRELAKKYPPSKTDRQITMREAFREALYEELRKNPLLRYIGEDVADPKGGVLGLTLGLSKEFPDQVRNTPISETAISGHVAGSGLFGYPAIGEFQFLPFTFSAGEPLFTFVPTRPAMTGFGCNCVYVAPFGIVPSSNNYHSDCIEIHIASLRGMKLIVPSTPEDMKGLMKSAIHDPDACFVLIQIYELGSKGPVPQNEYFTPIGVAAVRKEGKHITLITYGPLMVRRALEAAEKLEGMGISLEVIDLRTIVPWDRETVLQSVSKTGRVIVMHEASRSFHVGAELAASIVEDLSFYRLKARPLRLTAPNTPVPFHPNLEETRLPLVSDIIEAARKLMEES
uniref:Dehydrogenase E1 component n=1 Tax=uncultured prokaryote TaxID=198431 RepID=H5SEM2_9ZZZZ|nr:dehydrogenase E1 component [uncultured prokaryote]